MLVTNSPPNADSRPNSRPNSRRQSSGRRLSGFKPEELAAAMKENDDEDERNQVAQHLAEEEKKKVQKARSPVRGTPNRKLLDMYQNTIAMALDDVSAPPPQRLWQALLARTRTQTPDPLGARRKSTRRTPSRST